MVKIKVTRVEWSDEEKYIGNVYEAFEMKHPDGHIDYAAHVDQNLIVCFSPKNCEVIEEKTQAVEVNEHKPFAPTSQILMVEDGSVDVDDLEEWCDNNDIKLIIYRQGANKPEFLKY